MHLLSNSFLLFSGDGLLKTELPIAKKGGYGDARNHKGYEEECGGTRVPPT